MVNPEIGPNKKIPSHSNKIHPRLRDIWREKLSPLQRQVLKALYIDGDENTIPTIEEVARQLKTSVNRAKNARKSALSKLAPDINFSSETTVRAFEARDPFTLSPLEEEEN